MCCFMRICVRLLVAYFDLFFAFNSSHHPRTREIHVGEYFLITTYNMIAAIAINTDISNIPKNGLASIILRRRCGVVPVP